MGILGATHKAFEYNTVMECSEQFPSIKQLIDENVSAIHSNDYCVSLAMFGEYPKLDMNKATCDYYTCNPDGEMTGMVRTIIEGEK